MKPKPFTLGAKLTLLKHTLITKFGDKVVERELQHKWKNVPREVMQANHRCVFLGTAFSELEYPLKKEYSEEPLNSKTGTFKIEYEVCPGICSVLHYHYKLA